MANQNYFSDNKWYSNPIFSKFWNHYNQCNQWLEQNGHKVIQFNDNSNDNNCNKCGNSGTNSDNYRKCFNINCSGDDGIERTVSLANNTKLDSLEAIDENECDFDDQCKETEEIEELMGLDDSEDINEEYLKFVIETKRHQKERKRLREKKLRYNDRIEYIDISRLESMATRGVAPKTRQDKSGKSGGGSGSGADRGSHRKALNFEEKRQKMFELYGDDYKLIQGMEAALQLNFDRLCDLNQPKFWPVMPIRMPPNSS